MQANPNCRYCQGTGTVYDFVDYGSTRVPMPSQCDCVMCMCPYCKTNGFTEYWNSNETFTVEIWHCNLCNNSFEVGL